jgi:hypothetical protein
MKVEDVRIGTKLTFEGERTVWTVVGKRQVKGTKAVPIRFTLRLAFDDGQVRGQATTHPLAADAEVREVP